MLVESALYYVRRETTILEKLAETNVVLDFVEKLHYYYLLPLVVFLLLESLIQVVSETRKGNVFWTYARIE